MSKYEFDDWQDWATAGIVFGFLLVVMGVAIPAMIMLWREAFK